MLRIHNQTNIVVPFCCFQSHTDLVFGIFLSLVQTTTKTGRDVPPSSDVRSASSQRQTRSIHPRAEHISARLLRMWGCSSDTQTNRPSGVSTRSISWNMLHHRYLCVQPNWSRENSTQSISWNCGEFHITLIVYCQNQNLMNCLDVRAQNTNE